MIRQTAHPITTWALTVLAHIRRRAPKKGLPCTLTLSDLVDDAPTHCPVFRTPLEYGRKGRRGFHANSPSVDRIIPALGYVPTNILIVSNRANAIKNNATAAELGQIAAFYMALELHAPTP